MSWKQQVRFRFSEKTRARRWDDMYEKETENLSDHNFRLRRDHTVGHIVNTYDQNARICDIGCGAGPVVYELLIRNYEVVGLDYSIDMLRNAKRRLIAGGIENSPVINGNGESLPFQDNQFDCVVCLGVISYVENYENIIKEIYRILNPGGTVLISFRNRNNIIINDPAMLVKFLVNIALPFGRNKAGKNFEIGNYMSRGEVLTFLKSNNFSYEEFKGIGFGPFSINRRKIFGAKTSIVISRIITYVANKLKMFVIFKLASDVNILTLRKISCVK